MYRDVVNDQVWSGIRLARGTGNPDLGIAEGQRNGVSVRSRYRARFWADFTVVPSAHPSHRSGRQLRKPSDQAIRCRARRERVDAVKPTDMQHPKMGRNTVAIVVGREVGEPSQSAAILRVESSGIA